MPTITATRIFSASPEQVFDAWTKEDIARKWMFVTPTGQLIRVEIDPRVGGGFTITRVDDGVEAIHKGEFLEVDGPRRLVFDFWVEPYSKGEKTRVAIDIAAKGEGSELTLTHQGVWDEWEEKTKQGWETLLGQLAEVVEDE